MLIDHQSFISKDLIFELLIIRRKLPFYFWWLAWLNLCKGLIFFHFIFQKNCRYLIGTGIDPQLCADNMNNSLFSSDRASLFRDQSKKSVWLSLSVITLYGCVNKTQFRQISTRIIILIVTYVQKDSNNYKTRRNKLNSNYKQDTTEVDE
jgi:hypothetical protein